MDVIVVGWHIHPDAAECKDCDQPAVVVVQAEDMDVFNLCNKCLTNYKVMSDKIKEVFRNLGL